MRERLHLVGGEMSIHSQPKHGTKLDVRVPIGNSMAKVVPLNKPA
jgi:signal transduction histidine kinase